MNELISCRGCGGFAPRTRVSCPHCGRSQLVRWIAKMVGGGAFLITMSACYGAPPEECTSEHDKDGDGHCTNQRNSSAKFDCDDSNPTIHRQSPDIPNDGIDQDCDGQDQAR